MITENNVQPKNGCILIQSPLLRMEYNIMMYGKLGDPKEKRKMDIRCWLDYIFLV